MPPAGSTRVPLAVAARAAAPALHTTVLAAAAKAEPIMENKMFCYQW